MENQDKMLVNKIFLLVFLGYLGVSYGKKGFGSGDQEWGYVEVSTGSHIFWWLYYTTAIGVNFNTKPLIIWLQGGPGISSTGYGNFEEIGPLDVNLNPRNNTWVKDFNILFIDSPVGTGFSYTSSNSFTKTNAEIAMDLYVFIISFLEKFPRFSNVPIYIAGQTYGGKMAVEFASYWYQFQLLKKIKSNLKGVILGDAWISPIDSVKGWAPFLLQTGMIDNQGYDQIMKSVNSTIHTIENNLWSMSTYLGLYTQSVIANVTNNINFNNILLETSIQQLVMLIHPEEFEVNSFRLATMDNDNLEKLMNTKVKETLFLNYTWGEQSHKVLIHLWDDFMKSVVNKVEYLLNETNLKVFVYTGQLDLIVGSLGTLNWVEKLNWKNLYKWKKAPREPLVVKDIIEGYVKAYDRFKMYWINKAGNMIPNENPAGMKALLEDLISDAYKL